MNVEKWFLENHGIELTVEQLNGITQYQKKKSSIILADPPEGFVQVVSPDDDPEAKGIGRVIVGAVVGYFTGGYVGAVIGAVGALAQVLTEPRQRARNDGSENLVQSKLGFGSVGTALVSPGQVLPISHANANVNPNGGTRLAGYVIFSEIVTISGEQRRKLVYLVGQGVLGSINLAETLIDEQPVSQYVDNEISLQFRRGTQNQSPLTGFEYYSQVVRPGQFNKLSLDRRAQMRGVSLVNTSSLGLVNASSPTPTLLQQENGLPSGGFGGGSVDPTIGGSVAFTSPIGVASIGLSTNEIDQALDSGEFLFNFDGTFVEVVENGVVAYTGTYNPSDSFSIDVSEGPISQVTYTQNGNLLYTSINSPTAVLSLDFAFGALASSISDVRVNGIPPTFDNSDLYQFSTNDDEQAERLVAGSTYTFAPNTFIRIVYRNPGTRTFVFRLAPEYGVNGQGVTTLPGNVGSPSIYFYEYVRFENTKRVGGIGSRGGTNAACCKFNLSFNLHALDDENNNVSHGIIYEVWVRRTDQPLLQRLIRFVSIDNLRRKTFAMFEVENLPLGRYVWEIRPVVFDRRAEPIYRLGDFGVVEEVETSLDLGAGPVRVRGEFLPQQLGSGLESLTGFSKEVISSQDGPVGAVEFVCEQVSPEAIGKTPAEVNYPGKATVGAEFRVETQTGLSFLIEEGVEGFNHLAAGVSDLSSNGDFLVDTGQDFLAAEIRVGMLVENLHTEETAQVVEVGQTFLRLSRPLNFTFCATYRVGFIGSLAYYPDVFVYYLLNRDVGVGSYFPIPQLFVEWGSIQEAREFCVRENFYYDYTLTDKTAFMEWAQSESVNSRLILSSIGGAFELIPNEPKEYSFVFNASDTNSFSLESMSQEESKPNRLIVTFPDGRDTSTTNTSISPLSFDHDGHKRFRPSSVTIETNSLRDNAEPVSEVSLELQSVTDESHAARIGSLFLKSKAARMKASFNTSYIGLNLKAGDWVSALQKRFQSSDELSGYVSRVVSEFDPITFTQTIELSDCPVRWRDCLTTVSPGVLSMEGIAAFEFIRVGEFIRNIGGDLFQITGKDDFDSELTFTPAASWIDQPLEFLQTDFTGMEAIVMDINTHNVQSGIQITGNPNFDQAAVLTLTGLSEPLSVLSPLTIGQFVEKQEGYMVVATSPQMDGSITIEAIEIKEEFFDNSGLTFIYDDAGIVRRFE